LIPQTYVIDAAIATKIGLEKALVLQRICDWCAHNARNRKNVRDGRVWCYNTVKAWASEMPMIPERKMRDILDNLVARGLIVRAHYGGGDRTSWFSVEEKAVEALRGKGQETLKAADVPIVEESRPTDVQRQFHLPLDVKSICRRASNAHSLEQETTKKQPTGSAETPAGEVVWQAYEVAYEARYGWKPEKAPGDESALRTLARIPLGEAVAVVGLYVAHPRPFYAERGHELKVCAEDIRKLRSEVRGEVILHNSRKNGRTFERRIYAAVVNWWESRENKSGKVE
jgi:hypothetical protein